MRLSSVRATCEQKSSSVNNNSSSPSSVVSSETRPKRYSRIVFSLFKDSTIAFAAPIQRGITGHFVTAFLAHTFLHANLQFLLDTHHAHPQGGLRHFQTFRNAPVYFNLRQLDLRKIIENQVSALRGKLR